jgi:hypothetical protein
MLHGPGSHRRISLGSLWLLVAIGVAALTGANPVLVKQSGTTRDRHVRVYRTGQLRQSDGVEEIVPRQFDPVHDDTSDLIVSSDAAKIHAVKVQDAKVQDAKVHDARALDTRAARQRQHGQPHHATFLVATGTLPLRFVRASSTLVFTDDTQLPAPGHSFPHRGRAPPRVSL